MKKLMTVCLVLLFAVNVNAAVITFDEISPAGFLTEEYAALGIHFITTNDGSIMGGLSAGNPGNWGLEGTNGPAFLGFNSASSTTASFDVKMNYISLDVSRSNGSLPNDTFTLKAYNGTTLLDSQTVVLNSINDWTTVSLLVDNIDRIVWFGSGADFHPYGVDNLTFVPEPATIAILSIGVLSLIRRKK